MPQYPAAVILMESAYPPVPMYEQFFGLVEAAFSPGQCHQPWSGVVCWMNDLRHMTDSVLRACAVALVLTGVCACGGGGGGSASTSPPTADATRTWSLGFSAIPPRLTTAAVLQGIDLWSQRAEVAAIHEELPWTDLLAGMSPDAILDRDKVQLVD